MRTQIVALICALSAAACGGGDQAAKDPSTMQSDSTTTTNGTTAATVTAPASVTTSAAAPGSSGASPSMATPPPPNTGATSSTTPSPMAGPANAGATDATKPAPDNTKINDRDRHGTLTPMDQGSSPSETTITANIRKALMGDGSLSFTAKNVKVITVGTKVTLRGPVNTAQEKATIEAAAKQTQGVTDVDDQLEVKK